MFRISKPILMIVALLATFALGPGAAAAGEPGLRHRFFMAGSVIEASAESVYLCIGTAEGAKVGQVLEVVRIRRDRTVNAKHGVRFRRHDVATVKIESIVDEHFARASVVTGRAKKGDIVRLADNER